MRFIFVLLITLLSTLGFSQENTVILNNEFSQGNTVILNDEAVDSRRYDDIKGNPYLFKNFEFATLIDKKGGVLDSVLLNYNGHSKYFEYQRPDGKLIELDHNEYLGATFISSEYTESYFDRNMSDTTEFIKGLNFNDPQGLYINIFHSTNLTVIKEFKVQLSERELEAMGSTIMVQNFAPSFLYYFVKAGAINPFKLKKSSVLKLIDNKDVTEYVKRNKIKLNDEQDLKKVLTFYHQLLEE